MCRPLVEASASASEVTDEDAALTRHHARKHGRELVDDAIECPGTGGRVAPAETGAIVRVDTGELGDRRLNDCPTKGGACDARFEEHRRRTVAAASDMQTMSADVEQLAGRRERGRGQLLDGRAAR
jgi:hypothetical protein